MIPVDQTEFGQRGNCMAACLASILEIDIQKVPDFYQSDVNEPRVGWWNELRQWLAGFGVAPLLLAGHESLRDTWAIAGGRGPREFGHNVVWRNRQIVHDPHPSRAGLLEIEDYIFFVAMDPALRIKR